MAHTGREEESLDRELKAVRPGGGEDCGVGVGKAVNRGVDG